MSGGHGAETPKLFPSFGAENLPQETIDTWVKYVGPGAVLTLLADLVLPGTHPPGGGSGHDDGHH